MKTGKESVRVVLIALAVVCLAACTSLRQVEYAEAVRDEGDQLRSEEGLRVAGYVDMANQRHSWAGRAHLNPDGSLRLHRERPEPRDLHAPRASIKALLIREMNWGRTAGAVVVTGGVLAVAAAGAAWLLFGVASVVTMGAVGG